MIDIDLMHQSLENMFVISVYDKKSTIIIVDSDDNLWAWSIFFTP